MHFIDDDQISSIVAFHGVRLRRVLQQSRNCATLCVQTTDGDLAILKANFIPEGQASPTAQAFVAKLAAMKRIFARNRQLLIPECHLGLLEAGYLVTERPLLPKSLFQRIRCLDTLRVLG